MQWDTISFVIGVFVGAILGIFAACLACLSGRMSEWEEELKLKGVKDD